MSSRKVALQSKHSSDHRKTSVNLCKEMKNEEF